MKTITINKVEKELKSPGYPSKRFILSVDGDKPLFIIGLNPSTADGEKGLDHTMRKLVRFIELSKKFDSFIMLNLYAQRTKNPKELHKEFDMSLHKENLKCIKEVLQNKTGISVLAAWGNKINLKSYLSTCLLDIVDLFNKKGKVTWLRIGDRPTKSKHPFHPRNPGYDAGFHEFDITTYLKLHALK